MNEEFTEAEFEEWADDNNAITSETENEITALWGDGREVVFNKPTGNVYLIQNRLLGGGETDHSIERQGDRMVIKTPSGNHYVSATEFPIDP